MEIGVFNFSIKVSLNNFVTTIFFKNLSSQNSSQDVYLSVVGLKLVIYTHHRMLLSSLFCDQFVYIKVLVLDVTYLTAQPCTLFFMCIAILSSFLAFFPYPHLTFNTHNTHRQTNMTTSTPTPCSHHYQQRMSIMLTPT